MAFFVDLIAGDHLISHTVTRAVPSAQRGLTSVFGMGTGDPSQYGHRELEWRLAGGCPQPGAPGLAFETWEFRWTACPEPAE